MNIESQCFDPFWVSHSLQNYVDVSEEAIVWIDVETTGPSPERDELLEVGAHITDLSGNSISDGYQSLVHVPSLPSIFSKTSPNVIEIHEKSGLWNDLWEKESQSLSVLEADFLMWLDQYTCEGSVLYFGGNSITLDRNFLRLNLPEFYKRISHRSVDVTSLSIVFQSNSDVGPYQKEKAHRALLDVQDSIREYNYYLRHMKK